MAPPEPLYRIPPKDTPLKSGMSNRPTIQRTVAAEVGQLVEDDLKENRHLVSTREFLDTILATDSSLIEAALDEMQKQRLFMASPSSRWIPFPQSTGPAESHFYDSFVNVANAIVGAARARNANSEAPVVPSIWKKTPNKAPVSTDQQAARIRPDITAVLSNIFEDDRFTKFETEIRNDTVSAKTMRLWWKRIHVAVEVKKTSSQADVFDAIEQCSRYMRYMLKEQLDRRFALGLTLCKDELRVLLCDRSGLLSTDTAINIHQQPKDFIHVIIALALLNPSDLGWDLTMRLLIAKPPFFAPSFDKSVVTDDYCNSLFDTHWAIATYAKDGSMKLWFTIRALSIARAEVMCGRATIVWEVVELDPKTQKLGNKVYVLKQSWQPTEKDSEGVICNGEGFNYVRKLAFWGDVLDRGHRDTTKRIRKSLLPRDSDGISRTPPSAVVYDPDDTTLHDSTTQPTETKFVFDSKMHKVTERVLYRQIMEDRGWTIKFFMDHSELLRVLEHALEAHKELYFSGILHRDISVGNIIIVPEGADVKATVGRLIDLDYAKKTEEFFTPRTDEDKPKKLTTSLKKKYISLIDGIDQTLFSRTDADTIDTIIWRYLLASATGVKSVEWDEDISEYYRGLQNKSRKYGFTGIDRSFFIQLMATFDGDDLAVSYFVGEVLKLKPELSRSGRELSLEYLNAVLPTPRFHGIDETAFITLTDVFDNQSLVQSFVKDVLRRKPELLKLNRMLTLEDLDLISEDQKPQPDFSNHVAQVPTRTGTIAFMACEIVSKTCILEENADEKKRDHEGIAKSGEVAHDSVHDMESFMWVVIWICLTRDGPGGKRRKELDPADKSERARRIKLLVYCFFDGPMSTISSNKTCLFSYMDDMEREILPSFHPYFDPLKGMVVQWWKMLRTAYKYRIWTTIHDQFLRALKTTSDEVEKASTQFDTDKAATDAEIMRRMNDHKKIFQYLGTTVGQLPRSNFDTHSVTPAPWDNAEPKAELDPKNNMYKATADQQASLGLGESPAKKLNFTPNLDRNAGSVTGRRIGENMDL